MLGHGEKMKNANLWLMTRKAFWQCTAKCRMLLSWTLCILAQLRFLGMSWELLAVPCVGGTWWFITFNFLLPQAPISMGCFLKAVYGWGWGGSRVEWVVGLVWGFGWGWEVSRYSPSWEAISQSAHSSGWEHSVLGSLVATWLACGVFSSWGLPQSHSQQHSHSLFFFLASQGKVSLFTVIPVVLFKPVLVPDFYTALVVFEYFKWGN